MQKHSLAKNLYRPQLRVFSFGHKFGDESTIKRQRTSLDYYRILELQPNSNVDVIKEQYRKLAFKYHPDS